MRTPCIYKKYDACLLLYGRSFTVDVVHDQGVIVGDSDVSLAAFAGAAIARRTLELRVHKFA